MVNVKIFKIKVLREKKNFFFFVKSNSPFNLLKKYFKKNLILNIRTLEKM